MVGLMKALICGQKYQTAPAMPREAGSSLELQRSIQIDASQFIGCLDRRIVGETRISLVNASYDIEHMVYAVLCCEVCALLDKGYALTIRCHRRASCRGFL